MGQVDSILDMIYNGHVDDDLNDIIDACHSRKRDMGGETFDQLVPNITRVRISNEARIKPRYILGATGLVVDKRISKVTVLFDEDIEDPYGKWAGQKCVLDPSILEIIEPEPTNDTGAAVVTEIPL